MNKFSTPEEVNAEINGTLALLDTEQNLDEALRKNVVLFVGLAGSGKSTLCQFLAGNPNLRSVKVEGTKSYYISDGNVKVSESNTISKTLIPELVQLPNSDTVLADCPGFSDTRSAQHDIAAAVFTKQLLDKAAKVKIMVTVSHHSVQKGQDRSGFTNLLSHLVHFIKDIAKYENSIGLLVTKVQNETEEDEDGNFIIIPDTDVINGIGSFLNKVRTELMGKLDNDIASRQIQLIDIFIAKNNMNKFTKIGIFRKPRKGGDLNLDKRLATNKADMQEIMNAGLQTSDVVTNDFGLSLSVNSKYIATEMRIAMITNLSNILDDYIRASSQQSTEFDVNNLDKMKNAITYMVSVEDLLNSDIGPNMVVTNLMDQIHKFDLNHPAKKSNADWKNQQKYFQFLEFIHPMTESVNDYNQYSKRLNEFKHRITEKIKFMGQNAERSINQAIEEAIIEVMISFKNETVNQIMSSQQFNTTFPGQAEDRYKKSDQFKDIYQNNTNLTFKDFFNKFKVNFKVTENQKNKFESFQTVIDFFKREVKVFATFTDGHQEIWLQGFTGPINDIKEVVNTKLSNTLDEYIQVYTKQPNDDADDTIDDIKIATTRLFTVVDYLGSEFELNMVVTSFLSRIQEFDPEHPAQQYYTDWQNQQEFLRFLESVLPKREVFDDYSKYHIRLEYFKQKLIDDTALMVNKAAKIIDQAISEAITQVMITVKNEKLSQNQTAQLTYPKLTKRYEDIINKCQQLQSNNQNKPELTFKSFLGKIKKNFKISENQDVEFELLQENIAYFKNKGSAKFTDGHQEKWMQGFTAPLNDIKKEAEWYSFITDSYIKMTGYESENVVTSSKGDLKNWADFKVLRKQFGTNDNLDNFLTSRPTISLKEQIDLNNLIDAVKSSLTYSCGSTKLVVQSNHLKLSKVVKDLIPQCSSFTELYIFATQMVFIDVHLTLPGKYVYIIAPTWNIMGPKTIKLRGLDANSVGKTEAGDPGQPGGNFIGIGDNFINENDLTIDVSGGNGGNGKDGKNGENGADGRTPKVPSDTIWHNDGSHEYCDTRIKTDDITGWLHEGGNDVSKMFGLNGTAGTHGDNGGKYGFGAKSGKIMINALKINKIESSGMNGKDGKGGKGGTGGKHVQMRKFECTENTKPGNCTYRFTHIWFESNGSAKNGDDGFSGIAGYRVNPEPPRSYLPIFTVAMEYQQYIEQKVLHFSDTEFINPYVYNKRSRRSVAAMHAAKIVGNMNEKPPNMAIDHKSGARAWNPEFSLSAFVSLADVLIRKLMKTESTDFETHADPDWENLLIQAEVLNIVEVCEKNWNEANHQIKPQQAPFDPLCLQKELTRRLRQMAGKFRKEFL